MSFENKIQQWVQIDNQVKKLNEQIKQLREQRNSLETNLTTFVKTNNISDKTFNLNNDKLKFVETKVPEPLTFKYLEKTLGEIIKNETQVQLIMEHIKQKRTFKVVPEIKRFSSN
jgi:septal ring factor EnvC (AmiA/AmiB activator)